MCWSNALPHAWPPEVSANHVDCSCNPLMSSAFVILINDIIN